MLEIDIDLFSKAILPAATFVAGFFVSRFTLSKKERFDIEAQKEKRSGELATEQEKAFQAFCVALNKYVSCQDTGDLINFFEVATTGESYFSKLKITCDAIIAGKVDKNSIINTHKPMVAEAVNKSLPMFYETLQDIARKNRISYSGFLNKSNYQSIYQVYSSNFR